MTEVLALLGRGWTPGAVGIWVIVATLLLGLWKGLPGVLDAWGNSVAKERDHREREIKRLEDQISAADGRHNECLEGQRALRDEIEIMRRAHAEEISGLHGIITGMVVQMRQIQMTAASLSSDGNMSPALAAMFDQLDRIGKAGGKA